MSDPLEPRMELMRTSLATKYPARVVTRDLKDPSMISREDMLKGVYTILPLGERDYTNGAQYIAQDGRQRILLLGDFVIADNQGGSKIDAVEFTMMEEIKAWVRALPDALCMLALLGMSQSGQTANPYGWIAAELEYRP